MKVSILLLTYNEERNIDAVLSALSWCDDIVAIDSGSSDGTVRKLKSYGARVLTRQFDNFANQRNWGLDNAQFKNDWILHLDADEVVTDEFLNALDALEPAGDIDAFNVPSKLILFGKWIKYSGMYPTYQVRLGRRDQLRFVQVGHGQREDLPAARLGRFDYPYLHYSFSHGIVRWLEKHVTYAKDEADLILDYRKEKKNTYGNDEVSARRRMKARAASMPVFLRPFARFLYIYFVKQGFRDGKRGFVYAIMLSVFEGMTAILVYEKLLGGSAIKHKNTPETDET